MPCTYGNESLTRELSDELHSATRAACDLLHALRSGTQESDLAEDTLAWIAEHDEMDRRRESQKQEQRAKDLARQSGLAKLSQDERRALGL